MSDRGYGSRLSSGRRRDAASPSSPHCNSIPISARYTCRHGARPFIITITPMRRRHAGHSHAPDNFGFAFAIGAALNTAFVMAELVFGYAANSLALIRTPCTICPTCSRCCLAWAAWLAGAAAADRSGTPTAIAGPRSSRPLFNAGLLLVAVGGIAVEAVNRLASRPVAGWTVGLGRCARHPRQRRHGAVVHARPARRPQYPRRLSAYGGRCRRFARRGGRRG